MSALKRVSVPRATTDLMAVAGVPAASFIIPAFNAASTLSRTLESLRAQTCASWEAIVVDDGSTDGTREAAAAWRERDGRIRVIGRPNGGAGAARNTGLALATGTCVTFLDADDTVAPVFLERMLERLAAAGADAVCCGSRRRSRTGLVIEVDDAGDVETDLSGACRWMVPAAMHALLIHRATMLALGGFDTSIQTHEDWDLWIRIARAGLRVVREREALADYWCRPNSLTRNGPRMVRDHVAASARVRRLFGADPATEQRELAMSLLSSLSWNVAIAIGSGLPWQPIVESAFADGAPQGPFDADALAPSFLAGLRIGGEVDTRGVADRWTGLAPECDRFFDTVAARTGQPDGARALRSSTETALLRAVGRDGRTRVFATAVGAALGPSSLFRGVAVPTGRDRVVLTLPGSDRTLTIPAFGNLGPGAVRTHLARAGTDAVRRSRRVRRLLPQGALVQRVEARLRPLGAHAVGRARRLAGGSRPVAEPSEPGRGSAPNRDDGLVRAPAACFDPAARAILAASLAGEATTRRPGPAGDGAARARPADPRVASTALWDALYAEPDPWNYGAPYEQVKYERTLAILPEGRFGRVLELACAEGRFTERLAARADHLVAADISSVALGRARARCAAYDTIEYRVLDFFAGDLGTGWDLISCSEALYYMPDVGTLQRFVARLPGALAAGGHFVHAHGLTIDDDPDATGFDWGTPFGGLTVRRVLDANPALRRVRSLETPLYRIDLYRRADGAVPASGEATPEIVAGAGIGATLATAVAASVIPNGPERTRRAAAGARATRIPVLMYHRIASSGPDALAPYRVSPEQFERQLVFLRRRGFHAITLDAWRAARHGISVGGRPILITFDDAYLDFYQTGWELLRRYDFNAHMFVPTDRIGGCADWDLHHGGAAPLMDWRQLGELVEAGLGIGSHLATHRAAVSLASSDLLGEAGRSKARLEAAFGGTVTSVAPPYGAADLRTDAVCRLAGYTEGFRIDGGAAAIWQLGIATPRIEVRGDFDLDAFARALELDVEPPGPRDVPVI